MTTTMYRVAYPHPSLRPLHRVSACSVGRETYWRTLLSQLYEEYPKYTEDLKQATLWKVPPLLSIARCSALTGITG